VRTVREGLKKLCLIISAAVLILTPAVVVAESSNQLAVTMTPEIRIVEGHGNDEKVRYVPAHQIVEGQDIYYTVRIINISNEKVKRAVVIEPVPANTRLLEKSVTGAGASLSYSIDGGKSFISAAELHNSVIEQPSTTTQKVTHIRWQFRHPLAPHVTVLARFRVVFD